MAETSRTLQLKSLASNLPGANQQVQQGLEEARKTQLQATIKSLQPAQATTQAAQQLGAAQQAQAGQVAQQVQQQTQNQTISVGQMGLEEQARRQREIGGQQVIQLSEQERKAANKLAHIDSKLKNELLDKNLQFQKDKAGNQLFNTRQLMDYAAVNAKNEEEFKNYAQMTDQAYRRKTQILETAHKQLMAALERGYIVENKPLDQRQKQELLQAKVAMEKKIQEAQNDAANNSARNSAISGIIGVIAAAGITAVTGGAAAPYAPAIAAGTTGVLGASGTKY